jgi:hypothetical protein
MASQGDDGRRRLESIFRDQERGYLAKDRDMGKASKHRSSE